jgi:hypothetical protein
MRAKLITLWTIALLTCAGCPLTVIDTSPCAKCNAECDDGPRLCDACRDVRCPELAEE